MARKKVPRTLVALPSRRLLDEADHKTERLAEILRETALKNQREQPQVFHSMREVVKHFRVSFSTVSRVYHRLEQEGLLTRVRGAKTVLQGTHFDRHLGVRAFVCLPASLSAFVTVQTYRMFFITIRRELRLRGFATSMIFFDRKEARSGALGERLKTYEFDTVLWFQPPSEAEETVVRLADKGIRFIGVAHESVPTIPCRYHVRRDTAVRALLTEWRTQRGIDRVTLVQWKEHRVSPVGEVLHDALDELGIKWSSATLESLQSETFLRKLQKLKTAGIIFSSAQLASKLCFRAPRAVSDLLRTHRVAFLNGPVTMPFAKVPDVQVDLVMVDWQLVAERIVADLITQDAFRVSDPTIFQAEAKLSVVLSDFAQPI